MKLARAQQLEHLGVREALGLAPALLHQADPRVQAGQRISLQLGPVGVDGAVLAGTGLADIEGGVGIRREVEDERANVVGHVAVIDLGKCLEARHPVKHHRLAHSDPRAQVIPVCLVG